MALRFEASAAGIAFRVRLTPRGGRDSIDGVDTLADGTSVLRARVRAAPENGSANAALERLLAKTFDVPQSAVKVTRGGASRLKTLTIAGDRHRLIEILEKL